VKGESLPSFLHECGFIVGLALAPDGTILDSTDTFQALLKLAESPVGRPLQAFLFPEQPDIPERFKNEAPFRENMALMLRASDGSPVSLDAFLHGEEGRTVLLAPVTEPRDEGSAAKVSALGLEMANLARELAEKNRELEEAGELIKRLVNNDPLTGISNRRHFEDTAEKAMAFSRRQSLPLSIIMADIDHFRRLNDRYGHAVGDEALVAFARMLSRSCRFEDMVARHGGEEFIVMLPGTPLVPARAIAERLRENTEKLSIAGLEDGIRASFGVTEFLADETLEEMIARVDQALDRAKSRGRNRVEG
jgi:diguanylate cyclase (GGDEF)-like protein